MRAGGRGELGSGKCGRKGAGISSGRCMLGGEGWVWCLLVFVGEFVLILAFETLSCW
jgi:hypothetical protein